MYHMHEGLEKFESLAFDRWTYVSIMPRVLCQSANQKIKTVRMLRSCTQGTRNDTEVTNTLQVLQQYCTPYSMSTHESPAVGARPKCSTAFVGV